MGKKAQFVGMVSLLSLLALLMAVSVSAQTSMELLRNGGFESRQTLSPWVIETMAGGVVVSGPGNNGNPHKGNGFALLGGVNNETDTIEQSTLIPMNASSVVLTYALRILTRGYDPTPHDFLRVTLGEEGSSTVLAQYSNANASDWKTITLGGLEKYAGKLVTLRFSASTDGSRPTQFCLDDVSLLSTPMGGPHGVPSLQFISPNYRCSYPAPLGPMITGAGPLTLNGGCSQRSEQPLRCCQRPGRGYHERAPP